MYKLRLGVSIFAKSDNFFSEIDEAKTLGFHSIDYDLNSFGFENLPNQIETAKKQTAYINNSGLFFNGVHLPYGMLWDLSCFDEKQRLENVERIKQTIAWLDKYKPNCYVMHGSCGPVFDKDRPKRLENLIKSLRELQAFTKTHIAVENLPRTGILNTTEEILYVSEALDKKDFCIDVNHFLRERSEKAIERIGKRFITTHISDHHYVDECHKMPKTGKIDWMALIGALEKLGYDGVFNYELLGDPLKAIKANYDELFNEYNCIK